MPASKRSHTRNHAGPRWAGLTDAQLLELRFCELRLNLHNSSIVRDVDELYETLERRDIQFRPHIWLSTEWFSPDGIPGIAVPFFAAHPRLGQLERRIKGEAEGGNRHWRRRILRHEAGHALDTAFGLRRRPDWRAIFGRSSKPYSRQYAARPASRRFVQHLGHWYAQSHPTEDFAETFAVWLQPKARWRREYAGWPALAKLEYVDALMTEIAGKRAPNRDRSVVAPLSANKRRLRTHYRGETPWDHPSDGRYDAWLRRTFQARARNPGGVPANTFLARIEPELKSQVLRQTGVGSYLFGHVAYTLRRRTRTLDLVLRSNQREARKDAARLYQRIIEDLLRRNRERYVI